MILDYNILFFNLPPFQNEQQARTKVLLYNCSRSLLKIQRSKIYVTIAPVWTFISLSHIHFSLFIKHPQYEPFYQTSYLIFSSSSVSMRYTIKYKNPKQKRYSFYTEWGGLREGLQRRPLNVFESQTTTITAWLFTEI